MAVAKEGGGMGGCSYPLRHRLDQPVLGHLEEVVCCKDPKHPAKPGHNSDDVSKEVLQKMYAEHYHSLITAGIGGTFMFKALLLFISNFIIKTGLKKQFIVHF